jgi:ATP-binding protein involved in chromosome partitioning
MTDSETDIARRGPASRPAVPPNLKNVRNIIAIGSGKGGVGKSTITTNLAVALAKAGAKVAVMDADVYGPSQPGLLGAAGRRADLTTDLLKPLDAHGVGFMSVSALMDQDGPVVWRAPMAVKLLQDFIAHVEWGDRDYLLIDMPPGTGDVQLTLAQQAGLTGAVIVTTPQQVAMGIARKGLQMFQNVKVPLIGVVENMSGHLCSKCGHLDDVFLVGGGRILSTEVAVPFLGALPLDAAVAKSGDEGVPLLVRGGDSPLLKAFSTIARNFERETARINAQASAGPSSTTITAAGALEVIWADGAKVTYNPYQLRLACPCAGCVDEHTGQKILDPKRVPLNVRLNEVHPVGNYGLAPRFSDGHDTGIFTFERLKALVQDAPSAPATFRL